MRRLLTLLALFTCLAVMAGACTEDSSSDGEAPEPGEQSSTTEPDDLVPLDDWVEEVDLACQAFQEAGEAAEEAAGEDPTDEEILAFLAEAASIFDDLAGDVEAAGRPDEQTDEADELLSLIVEAQELLVEAADADSTDEAEALVAEVEERNDEADVLAGQLGLTECADDDEDGDDPSSPSGGDLVPLDDWVEQVNAICAANEPDEEAAQAQVEAATSEAEVLAAMDELVTVASQEIVAVQDVGLPDEQTAQAEELLGYLDELLASFEALAAAESLAEVQALFPSLEEPEQLDPLTRELGLTDCADD